MTSTIHATPLATGRTWTTQRAIILASLCLLAGVTGGWFLHMPQSMAANAAPAKALAGISKQADVQAAPLLEELKSDPNNPDILTGIGNLYYDAQQYSPAIEYYGRALALKPADVSVRTDRGTALWYLGNADAAIADFDKALVYAPTNANTLFNRGLVEWKGKSNATAALADWNKLLATNPNYQSRDKVQQMIAEIQQATSAR